MSRSLILAAALAAAVAASPAAAETVTCPDLAAAQQVGTCPTPQELKWGFTGYCSDNARMYDKEDTCASFENYKQLKDVALWEAGEFQGYLSCALPPETVRSAKPAGLSVSKVGPITKVTCSYDGGLTLSLRTRKTCTAEGGKAECE